MLNFGLPQGPLIVDRNLELLPCFSVMRLAALIRHLSDTLYGRLTPSYLALHCCHE